MLFTKNYKPFLYLSICLLVTACAEDETLDDQISTAVPSTSSVQTLQEVFGNNIDLNSLPNYANQDRPNYIQKDNTENNPITNRGAILGRVLFYDKNLSIDNSISCASCHQQSTAFSDTRTLSQGVQGGITGRHSMRLVNSRFANEPRFFWDERAATLEEQVTQPIQDHAEMGFSGEDGRPGFQALVTKLEGINYYQELFNFVYGDSQINEERMQDALAQFIRSIQSFDSRFDQGRQQVNNNNTPFPNFTDQENLGKQLFLNNNGGAGCQRCHRAPEFDIDPNSDNNGIVGIAGNNGGIDVNNTRSPSLRDLVNANGQLNGPMMHNGSLTSLEAVVNHYNQIPDIQGNNNLDRRLRGNLQLSQEERTALVAFLRTLSGENIYSDPKWSDPFLNP